MSNFIWVLLLGLMFLVGIGFGDYSGRHNERIRILNDIKAKILEKNKGSHTIYEEFQLILDIIASKDGS